MNTDKIRELERKVAELKQSIPPHSVKPEMLLKLEELGEELQKEKSKGERISFGSYVVVACGTLAPEINYLKKRGFLDARKILFTKPGRHENYRELESDLTKQINNGKKYAERIIVIYGGKYCYVNPNDPYRSIDNIIIEQGPGISRIKATHCVDMLASEEDRDRISKDKRENAYWFTPGWLIFRHHVFQDRDKGFAIENFPGHKYTEGAILLDGIGFFEKYSTEHPEEVLDFSDWMELPIKAHNISLDRLENLLLEVVEQDK